MPADLVSVQSKLSWAKHHFNIVDSEISVWLNDKSHRIIHEHNEDFTQHYLRAQLAGDPPDFTRWSLMIGDCLTNLRDTLDHMVSAIAKLPSSPNPSKRDKTAFLVTSSPNEFNEWGRTKLASVPQAIRDSMLSFQPFNRPNGKLPPLISILSELANGNKHRVLRMAFASPELRDVKFITTSGMHQPATSRINKEEIKDGTVLLVFEVPNPDPDIELHTANVFLSVVLEHTPLNGDTSFNAGRSPYEKLIPALFREVGLIPDTFEDLV